MKIKTAVVGCGAISEIYLQNTINTYSTLEVVCCTDLNEQAAKEREKQFGIKAVSYERILADKEIRLVLILTPAPAHYSLVKQALEAGKHVYTEKPLTETLQQAKDLMKIASEKGLMLGSAPETFMGSCFQTARKALDDGVIGEVTGFSISANRDTELTAALFPFIRKPGGDICSDYGIYYLTALVSLLGPTEKVFAYTSNPSVERHNPYPGHPQQGQSYIYDNESQVHAVVRLKSGVTGTFALNGESNFQDVGVFYIYGTKGILKLGDANQFGLPCEVIPNDYSVFTNWRTIVPESLEDVSKLRMNCRGIGPAEMGWAIANGGKSITNMDMSYHVLETIHAILTSGQEGREVSIESSCEIPSAFAHWEEIF